MSIEKLDFDTIDHEKVPFTIISTHVIQNIKNHFAGFIWVYLQSLPPKWKVNKYHIMQHFDISERTYQRHMSFLTKSNLIKYETSRLDNGTLCPVVLKVLNGTKFIQVNHTAKNGVVDTTPPKMADRSKTLKSTQVIDSDHTAKKPHSGEMAVLYKENKIPYKENINIYMGLAKNCTTSDSMQISDLMDCNPFGISEMLLCDWISIRKAKNQIITVTAWDTLNKELDKCEDPSYAFGIMVSNGWSMLNGDKFKKNRRNKNTNTEYDNESTEWIKKINDGLL
jgi:hypothetical protein